MEEEKLRNKFMVYSLSVNMAGLSFAAAALFLYGPLAALIVFVLVVTLLLAVIYRKKVSGS